MYRRVQLLQDVGGVGIKDTVDSVQTQGVDMVFSHPVEGVVDKITAHLTAILAIVVHRLAPRGLVTVGKVGTVLAQVVALRPKMVVDHVQHDSQPFFVAGVD